jgi:syntaxin 1B/2/3
MEPLTGGSNQYDNRPSDPNAILNSCREIDQGIKEIERAMGELQTLHKRVLDNPEMSNTQFEAKAAEIQAMYKNLIGRMKSIKMKPESGSPRNAQQVGFIDRKLRDTYQTYTQLDAEFRRRLEDQMKRQYRIVRPDAPEEEVRRAVEQGDQQVFSQALMQSDRRGQSRSALNAVQARHEAIQKIEQQMIELAQLFQDMENLVVQQEAAVVNIEMKGEEVVENMDKGNEQLTSGIKSARNARKWKWYCLGISGTSSPPCIFKPC